MKVGLSIGMGLVVMAYVLAAVVVETAIRVILGEDIGPEWD